MKLLFDAMLKNTAKWARLFGVDSVYITEEDKDVLKSASEGGKILVTMDKDLSERAKKQGINTIFLSTVDVSEQLYKIEQSLEKEIFQFPDKTRCTACNGDLRTVGLDEVKGKIPEKVAKFHKEFWLCINCGKIYWEGGHWKNITKTYEELKKRRTKSM